MDMFKADEQEADEQEADEQEGDAEADEPEAEADDAVAEMCYYSGKPNVEACEGAAVYEVKWHKPQSKGPRHPKGRRELYNIII